MNCPQPIRRPSASDSGLVNHFDASTDVPSSLKALIWWLSNVVMISSAGSSSMFPMPTFSPYAPYPWLPTLLNRRSLPRPLSRL